MDKCKNMLATASDIGAAQAMIPVLHRLQKMGCGVTVCVDLEAPAHAAFRSSGLATVTQNFKDAARPYEAMDKLIERGCPDAIMVGVSDDDMATERLVMDAATKRGIPTCLVLESWPDAWLGSYGARDLQRYRLVDLICVCDETAREALLRAGFPPRAVVVTGNPCHDSLYTHMAERERYRREMRERFRIPADTKVAMWAITWDLDDESRHGPESPEWLGFSERDLLKEFLDAMAKHVQDRDHVRGLVRQKPSYGSSQVRKSIAEICPSAVFDNSQQPMGIMSILAADLVIGCRTILVQTAALLGLPAVYYMPGLRVPDPMATNKLGITVPLYEPGALEELVRNFSASPEETAARLLSRMRIPAVPKNAAEAIAATIIESLLKEEK